MSVRGTISFFLVLLVLPLSPLIAQTQEEEEDDLAETMGRLVKDAARSYVSPAVSGFGADLNSGWFHRAPWATMIGFDFEFGVVGMFTLMQEENRHFSSTGSFRFNRNQADFLAQQAGATSEPFRTNVRDAILNQEFAVNFSGPTIAGSRKDSLSVGFPGKTINVNGTDYNLPARQFTLPVTGLLDGAPIPLLPVPQLTFGTLLGSQFTFRYLPEVELSKELGNFKFFGFGIQHNPMVWFGEDAFPFEVSLGYFKQNMQIGTLMNADAASFGLNASVRIGWGFLNLTPYAGYMIESSEITWTYDYTIDTPTGTSVQRIEFSTSGENTSRITLGASVKVLFVNVNLDISLAKYRTVSAGIMIII